MLYNINQYQISMRLGQQVLSKIENLLTRIDNKEPRKRQPKKIAKENQDINSTFNKLHEDHKKKLTKIQQKQLEKETTQNQKHSPFKITNKHTIFINSQLNQPPIYQRLEQLQNQKFEELMRLKEKYPPKPREKQIAQDEAQVLEMLQRKRNQRKYSQREMEEKMRDLLTKEHERQERLNLLKVKAIQQHSKDFRCKPYVNRQTNQIWKRCKLKKQLSTSVFQRFEQYQISRRNHLEQTSRKIRNEVTPFNPKISQNSRLLASRSSSRSNLHQKMTRSISCKCFQRSKDKKLNTSTAMHSSRKY